MAISTEAIKVMTKAAQETGYSSRDDYADSEGAVISAGDYKGASTVVCIFNDEQLAKQWLDRANDETTDLAGRHHTIVRLYHEPTGGEVYVAVLMAYDLVAKDQIDDRGEVQWD